jgi:cytochrome c peroxidase
MPRPPSSLRWILTLVALLGGCAGEDDQPVAVRPVGFPAMAIPDDNPLTAPKAELGRYLFYDKRLSGNGTQACASCHEQALAFTDGKVTPRGSTGHQVPRNAQSLANVGYLPVLTWANTVLRGLEAQIRVPLFADIVVEMGATGHEVEILARLRRDPLYMGLFHDAFPSSADPFTWQNVIAALASFQRTLISGDSPFDRYFYRGDKEALSAGAKRGMALFNDHRLECYHCHEGFNYTSAVRTRGGEAWKDAFFNTGLYNVDGKGGYPANDTGLMEVTENPADMGKFRVPTLRNIEVTAPYMHDGSIPTLEEAIDHYAAGGRTIHAGPHTGDGSKSPLRSRLVSGFAITPQEKADLVEFLKSLTDRSFLTNPRHADPFAKP